MESNDSPEIPDRGETRHQTSPASLRGCARNCLRASARLVSALLVMVVVVVAVSRLRGFWRKKMFDHSFPACALSSSFFFFFLSGDQLAHINSTLRQYRSTVAQRPKSTVAECFLTSCVRVRFLIGSDPSPCLDSDIVSPLRLLHDARNGPQWLSKLRRLWPSVS